MTTGPAPRLADDTTSNVLCNALTDQNTSGWDNFAKGRISVKWKGAQQRYINALQPSKTAKIFDQEVWSLKGITYIWSIFWQIWNAQNAHLRMEMQEMLASNINQQVKNAFLT
eukprot:9198976-Ditylum_brightwellii.AAC.1